MSGQAVVTLVEAAMPWSNVIAVIAVCGLFAWLGYCWMKAERDDK